MKIETRGKYPGIKVHLDPDECVVFLALASDHKKEGSEYQATSGAQIPSYFSLSVKLGKKIAALREENPTLFDERTPEQIHATLSKELIESQEKLAAIGKGADWKKIKVEVMK